MYRKQMEPKNKVCLVEEEDVEEDVHVNRGARGGEKEEEDEGKRGRRR